MKIIPIYKHTCKCGSYIATLIESYRLSEVTKPQLILMHNCELDFFNSLTLFRILSRPVGFILDYGACRSRII